MENNIQTFMEITGMSQVASIRYLSMYSNNLEEALSAHFSTNQTSTSHPPNPPTTSPPSPPRNISSSTLQNPQNPVQGQTTLPISSFYSYFKYSLTFGWNTLERYALRPAKSIAWGLIQVICAFFATLVGIPILSQPSFKQFFEAQYGNNHPQFFEGPYRMAISTAMREKKLLAIYVHYDGHPNFDNFLNEIIRNPNIKSLLDQHFILFAQKFSDMRSNDVPQPSSYLPMLIILLPQSFQSVQQLTFFDVRSTSSNVISGLDNILLQVNTYQDQLGVTQAQYEDDRRIREQQDLDYQEALKMDAEKETKRKEEEDKQWEITKSIETKQKEDEKNKLIKSQLKSDITKRRKALAEDWSKRFDEINKAQTKAKTKISLRLPSGKRIEQHFLLSQTIEDIYTWTDCCQFIGTNKPDIKIPHEFELSVPSLNIQLNQREKSIDEMGLYPNAVVFLMSLEESEYESE